MKKFIPIMAAFAFGFLALTGCSSGDKAAVETTAVAAPETTAAVTTAAGTSAAESAASEAETASDESVSSKDISDEPVVRIGGLKGPTTMGLVKLMEDAADKTAKNNYEFTMVTAADELTALIAAGKVDIALLPANLASVLYNKTNGGVSVIDINTLGVLYLVSSDTSIETVDQLKGKTVYLPGKGTTPEYALRYLISASGLSGDDVTLEFKSEASEVASILAEEPTAIGLLPQPFVTSALAQNDKLSIVMDLTKAWDEYQTEGKGSRLVTGVTIVNNEFLESNTDSVNTFLEEHEASILFTESDPDTAAELIAAAGIIPKAPLAKKALPFCNIKFLSGEEMKAALSGYLEVLFEQNAASVGGALPDDTFYYMQ
ncbi:ABC transporter substrate-binding protein [Lachnospiraceae bacterium 45-P1]